MRNVRLITSDELGVKSNASLKEIKQRFSELAKIYHPDRNPEESEKFSRIVK
jgi:curved DNA-binding protein CbpA